MTNDMLSKANDGKVINIDPLSKNLEQLKKKMLDDILLTGGIEPNQRIFLTVNADREATDRLNA
jgi:hypothetical protein